VLAAEGVIEYAPPVPTPAPTPEEVTPPRLVKVRAEIVALPVNPEIVQPQRTELPLPKARPVKDRIPLLLYVREFVVVTALPYTLASAKAVMVIV
jgi:hypothetical protein